MLDGVDRMGMASAGLKIFAFIRTDRLFNRTPHFCRWYVCTLIVC